MKKIIERIKKIDRKYSVVALSFLTFLLVFFGVSYAYFRRADILKNFSVIVGDLTYTLQSDSLNSSGQVVVAPGETKAFDILVTSNNSIDSKYQMVYSSGNDLTNVEVGYNIETTDASSGVITANGTKVISVVINNNGSSTVTILLAVRGGLENNSVEDIILASADNRLDMGLEYITSDITIASVTIDGKSSSSLPQSGTYTLSNYTCKNNSTLSWNTYTKSVTFSANAKRGESCSLEFTTNTNYPLLIDVVKQGDYIAYEGNNGCLRNGTSVTGTSDAENGNSCLGYNANANTDGSKDTGNNTYGYCSSESYKYYVSGWRIAYTDSGRAYIISAGSPECNTRPNSTNGNTDYIELANSQAKKYCNSNFVDDCTSDTDVHAINDTDFNKMTAQMTGTTGGYLYTSITGATKCGTAYSKSVCGYNNDLIDNGGHYWFAAAYTTSSASGVYWDPNARHVYYSSDTLVFGLRPVIRLSSGVYITGGSGTIDDPYTIKK